LKYVTLLREPVQRVVSEFFWGKDVRLVFHIYIYDYVFPPILSK
jgi:hypothetical protein